MITQARILTKKPLMLILLLSLGAAPLSVAAEQSPAPEVQASLDWEQDQTEQELPTWRKVVHWYFATAGMMYQCIRHTISELYPDHVVKKLPTSKIHSPELRSAIENTISDFGFNSDTIKVHNTPLNTSPAGAIGGNVLIDERFCAQHGFSLDEMRFMIGHELAHLENKDNLKMVGVAFAAPFIAHFGLKVWDAGIKKLLSAIKKITNTKSGSHADTFLKKINDINHWLSTFCITKALVASQLFCAYFRYCEKQADLKSLARLGECEGAQSLFKNAQAINKAERNTDRYYITSEGDNHRDSLHPLFSERLAYTKEYCEQHCNTPHTKTSPTPFNKTWARRMTSRKKIRPEDYPFR